MRFLRVILITVVLCLSNYAAGQHSNYVPLYKISLPDSLPRGIHTIIGDKSNQVCIDVNFISQAFFNMTDITSARLTECWVELFGSDVLNKYKGLCVTLYFNYSKTPAVNNRIIIWSKGKKAKVLADVLYEQMPQIINLYIAKYNEFFYIHNQIVMFTFPAYNKHHSKHLNNYLESVKCDAQKDLFSKAHRHCRLTLQGVTSPIFDIVQARPDNISNLLLSDSVRTQYW